MVENWNKVVGPKDLIYHLGDVAIQRSGLKILERLNGRKKLIRGNHDIWKIKDYLPYFEDVAAIKVMPEHRLLFSHYPLHPSTLYGGKLCNHGHTHANEVCDENGQPDPRYINLCVEHTNYAPIEFGELLVRVAKNRELIEQRKAIADESA